MYSLSQSRRAMPSPAEVAQRSAERSRGGPGSPSGPTPPAEGGSRLIHNPDFGEPPDPLADPLLQEEVTDDGREQPPGEPAPGGDL